MYTATYAAYSLVFYALGLATLIGREVRRRPLWKPIPALALAILLGVSLQAVAGVGGMLASPAAEKLMRKRPEPFIGGFERRAPIG